MQKGAGARQFAWSDDGRYLFWIEETYSSGGTYRYRWFRYDMNDPDADPKTLNLLEVSGTPFRFLINDYAIFRKSDSNYDVYKWKEASNANSGDMHEQWNTSTWGDLFNGISSNATVAQKDMQTMVFWNSSQYKIMKYEIGSSSPKFGTFTPLWTRTDNSQSFAGGGRAGGVRYIESLDRYFWIMSGDYNTGYESRIYSIKDDGTDLTESLIQNKIQGNTLYLTNDSKYLYLVVSFRGDNGVGFDSFKLNYGIFRQPIDDLTGDWEYIKYPCFNKYATSGGGEWAWFMPNTEDRAVWVGPDDDYLPTNYVNYSPFFGNYDGREWIGFYCYKDPMSSWGTRRNIIYGYLSSNEATMEADTDLEHFTAGTKFSTVGGLSQSGWITKDSSVADKKIYYQLYSSADLAVGQKIKSLTLAQYPPVVNGLTFSSTAFNATNANISGNLATWEYDTSPSFASPQTDTKAITSGYQTLDEDEQININLTPGTIGYLRVKYSGKFPNNADVVSGYSDAVKFKAGIPGGDVKLTDINLNGGASTWSWYSSTCGDLSTISQTPEAEDTWKSQSYWNPVIPASMQYGCGTWTGSGYSYVGELGGICFDRSYSSSSDQYRLVLTFTVKNMKNQVLCFGWDFWHEATNESFEQILETTITQGTCCSIF